MNLYETNTLAGRFHGLALMSSATGQPSSDVDIVVGTGAPASATYGGQTIETNIAVALRKDAPDANNLVYVTTNLGVAWTPLSTASTTDFGAGGLKTDLIVESTGDAGVTLESFKFEDEGASLTVTTSNVPMAWTHTANGAADDFTITLAGATDSSIGLVSQGTGLDAMYFTTTAGGMKFTSASGLSATVTGAVGLDATGAIEIESSGGKIKIGTDAVAQNIEIGTSGARSFTIGSATSAGMTIDAGTGNLVISADASISLASTGDFEITSNHAAVGWHHDTLGAAEDLTFYLDGATDSSIMLISEGTGADALRFQSTAGGIDIDAALAIAFSGAGIDLVSTDHINLTSTADTSGWTHTTTGNAQDLVIALAGATNSSLGLTSTGTAGDAMYLTASAGGIDISATLGLDLSSGGAIAGWTHTSAAPAQDLTVALAGATDSSLILSSTGTGADALQITASAGGLVIASNNTTSSWTHTSNGAGDDLTISVAGATDSSLILSSTGTGADALQITASAGGVVIASANETSSWTHTSNGAGDDLTIAVAGANDASLILSSTGTGADALQITASAGGLVVASANQTSSWTHTSNGAGDDLTISVTGATDSSLVLSSTGTGTDAIQITASAGGLVIASANQTSSWTHTSNGAADDLTIAVAGANDASLILSSTGTGADALQITTSAGGMDISSAGDLDITSTAAAVGWTHTATNDAQDLTISVAGVFDSSLLLSAAGTGADAIGINASAGGVAIAGYISSSMQISGNSAGNLTLTLNSVNAGAGEGRVLITADGRVTIGGASNPTLYLDGTGGVVLDEDKRFSNAAAELAFWDDDTFRVVDEGDLNKRFALQCSGITTGNTRTLTVADRDQVANEFDVVSTADPGTGIALNVAASRSYAFTVGAGAETNTLAVPTFAGQEMHLYCDTNGGGTRTVTVAAAYDQAAHTTIALNTVADYAMLKGIRSTAAGGLAWRLVVNDGCTLG